MCTVRQSPAKQTSRAVPRRARLTLWQLDPRLHCSVIGTCLSLDDLRRACTRVGLQLQAPVSDYELHHAFVAMADRPLPVIRLLNKTLERRHRDTIVRFARSGEPQALSALWQEAVEHGEIPGAYWALLTCPGIPEDLRERATGEVHMLSHLSGASQRADLRRLNTLERRVASLNTKLERSSQTYRQRQREHLETIQRLQTRLRHAHRAERQLADARARIQALESDHVVSSLRSQVEYYAAQLAESRLRSERAETAYRDAQVRAESERKAHAMTREQLRQSCREREALEALTQAQLNEPCTDSCAHNEERCDLDLCGRCILYVGGRQNVTAHLAKLVQRCNGRLICHDGGQEDSRAHLANLLPQADAVVCPVDCVSHDAYQRVKQFCKQYAKRLVLLPTASLSAFTRGLQEVSAAAR